MKPENDTNNTAGSDCQNRLVRESFTPSDERHPCRTWAANEHEDTMLVLADYADHIAAERAAWKSAMLRIHPTGRGTPDEMATDILQGMEAARNALKFNSANSHARPRTASGDA
jgi:hypothetical protein